MVDLNRIMTGLLTPEEERDKEHFELRIASLQGLDEQWELDGVPSDVRFSTVATYLVASALDCRLPKSKLLELVGYMYELAVTMESAAELPSRMPMSTSSGDVS